MSDKRKQKDSTEKNDQRHDLRKDNQREEDINDVVISTKMIQSLIVNHLSALMTILHNKLYHNVSMSFYSIMNVKDSKDDDIIEALKTKIILRHIHSAKNVFVKYYSNRQKIYLRDGFVRWIRIKNITKEGINIKKTIEDETKTKTSNKKKSYNKSLLKKERELTAVKTQLAMINDSITRYNKTLKIAEEKENVFINNIQRLDEDNSQLDKELKDEYDDGDTKRKQEMQIKELQSKLRALENDAKEKEESYMKYIKETNQMLDFFEKNMRQMKNKKDAEIAIRGCKSPTQKGTYTLNSYNGISTIKGPIKEGESTSNSKSSKNNLGKAYTLSTNGSKTGSLGMILNAFGSPNTSNNPSKR